MARKLERIDAKRLYTEELKNIPEIATQLNVPEKTVYRWKQEDLDKGSDWDKERESIRMTSASAYKQALKIAIDKLNSFAAGGEVNVKEADAIMKIVKAAKSLYKDVDALGNIYLAIEEWVTFLQEHDAELLKQMLPLLDQFRQAMSNKYGRKR